LLKIKYEPALIPLRNNNPTLAVIYNLSSDPGGVEVFLDVEEGFPFGFDFGHEMFSRFRGALVQLAKASNNT
jgi:hypothetical protein